MPSIYRNGIQYSSNGGLESAAITAGVIVPYAGDTAPVGWLLCDGSAVSRTTYSVLFDVIGTTYGSGDGSTTFNVPDLNGTKRSAVNPTLIANATTSSPWTADSDGVVVCIAATTNNARAYWYIIDKTDNVWVAVSTRLETTNYNLGVMFPVTKGHQYYSQKANISPSEGGIYKIGSSEYNYIISIGAQNGGETYVKELLWTNNSPTSGFAPQALLVGQDLTEYDEIEIHGINFTSYGSVMPALTLKRGEKGNLIGLAGSTGDASGVGFLVARGVTFGNDRIVISEAMGVATNSSQWAAGNNNMIPTRIYGIKIRGGA